MLTMQLRKLKEQQGTFLNPKRGYVVPFLELKNNDKNTENDCK